MSPTNNSSSRRRRRTRTAPAENVHGNSDNNSASDSSTASGAWVGLDWGTTNSGAAVYGRAERGRPKWLRLPFIAAANSNSNNGKVGRVVPSVALFATATYLDQRRQRKQQRQQQGSSASAAAAIPPPKEDSPSSFTPEFPWMDVTALFSSSLGNKDGRLCVCIGAPAAAFGNDDDDRKQEEEEDPAAIQAARVVSLKRQLLTQLQQQNDKKNSNKSNSMRIAVTPLGMTREIQLDAVAVVACFLKALRQSSDLYLQTVGLPRKKLAVPGHAPLLPVRHACLGVPAQSDQRYRQLLLEAAAKAGFATATTLAESTAAAVAYGLFVGGQSNNNQNNNNNNNSNKKTILVFDMGGGTTDVTIAERTTADDKTDTNNDTDSKKNDATNANGGARGFYFRVALTAGNNQLGGDDMDHAVLELALRKMKQMPLQSRQPGGSGSSTNNDVDNNDIPAPHQRAEWLRRCRAAKEQLCGSNKDDGAPPNSVTVTLQGVRIAIQQEEFVAALQPILQQTRRVVESALNQYRHQLEQNQQQSKSSSTPATTSPPPAAASAPAASAAHALIDEVILIGGATAVPAVRHLLSGTLFPQLPHGLCLSVNAHSAVAQGCAVAAALESRTVPLHELESALMLDTSPHPIGVSLLTDKDDGDEHEHKFVEILPANATLPAKGFATFYLADPQQRGVTVQAVECVSVNNDTDNNSKKTQYIPLGEFTFLLHRSAETVALTSRSVDIGMVLRTNGEFVVSVFDPLDPEHRRRRERHWKDDNNNNNNSSSGSGNIIHHPRHVNNDDNRNVLPFQYREALSREQVLLMVACAVVFVLYVAAKIAFADREQILREASAAMA